MSERSDLRVAVLGCGSIGRRHLRNLAGLGVGKLLAYDPVEAARVEAAAETGATPADELEQVWAFRPRVLFVTAPTDQHVSLAAEAARRDCDLFIEKPLSHNKLGLDELRSECTRRGLVAMIGCNMRFHPGPAAVKALLEENAVGRVLAARIHSGSYLPRWRPWQDYRTSYSASVESGGAILDCIHELDLAGWFFGAARVIAAAVVPADSLGLRTDGLSEILLKHDSGILSSIHLNFVQRDYRRTCQIIGANGTISWDFGDECVRIYGEDGRLARVIESPKGYVLDRMYVDELTHFLDAIETRTRPWNSLEDAAKTLDLAISARAIGTEGNRP